MLSGLLIAIDILVCIALVGVVLLQRSEGGAFGTGGGPTGLITARGAGDLLTRTTWVLFSLFLALSLGLTLLGAHERANSSIIQKLKLQQANPNALGQPATPPPSAPIAPTPVSPAPSLPPSGTPAAPLGSGPLFAPSGPATTPLLPTAPAATGPLATPGASAPTHRAAHKAQANESPGGTPFADSPPESSSPPSPAPGPKQNASGGGATP
jgi:preprotein translocase subunit SecG